MADRGQTTLVYDSSGQIDSTGSANAYVIRVSEQISAYHRGMAPIRFKANFGNSGSATANIATELSPSGLGAVTMKKGGGASDLASGDIVSGGVYTLIYDGTFFQVLELNGVAFTLADDAVTNAKLANMAESTIKGRAAGAGTGDPQDLTATQATAILNTFTAAANGLVPASGGGTANFLRADGSFAAPPSPGWTYATEVNTTSGTTVDLATGLPAGITEIEVMFRGVSPSLDNSEWGIQIGDSGGFETTGYTSAADWSAGTIQSATDKFTLSEATSFDAALTATGTISLSSYDSGGTKWHASGIILYSAPRLVYMTGSKDLNTALTQVRFAITDGAAFDAGTAVLRYK